MFLESKNVLKRTGLIQTVSNSVVKSINNLMAKLLIFILMFFCNSKFFNFNLVFKF
jgi:hypothetical protein